MFYPKQLLRLACATAVLSLAACSDDADPARGGGGDTGGSGDTSTDTGTDDTADDTAEDSTDTADDTTDTTDTTPERFEPEVVVCGAPVDTFSETCTVTGTGPETVIKGTILTGQASFEGGLVRLGADGAITCVGCECDTSGATLIDCGQAVVSPGLINAHDHLTFTQNAPGSWGEERFDHRHDWRRGLRGHNDIPVPGNATTEQRIWGELRQVLVGTTSMAGSGSGNGLVRNLDRASDNGGLGTLEVGYQTFPLGDNGGEFSLTCDYPEVDSTDVLNDTCYLAHVAEGVDAEARNEFLCLSGVAEGSVDLAAPNSAFVHAIGLLAIDGQEMAASGTSVVWSPRSNIALYGNTAPVTMYHRQGVRLALGTDWTASGSVNIQRELACARELNENNFGGYFTAYELWRMVTVDAAGALQVDSRIGDLSPGLVGDIAIFGRTAGVDPWAAAISAEPAAVRLVLKAGVVMYGDSDVVGSLPGNEGQCESVPDGVCGAAKSVCLAREANTTFAAVQGANARSYGLFFCGTPDNEPTCTPFRPGEYAGVTEADEDGDGVPNEVDDCPDTFNPRRPVDSDSQADHDFDGLGDACDPCPTSAGAENCSFDPADRDSDGALNEGDNCPNTFNPDQADADSDGIGDLCDLCRNAPNPGGAPCPATIYDIKLGNYAVGTTVSVEGVVTAVAGNSWFMQVAPDAEDNARQTRFAGVYVYTPSSNPAGLDIPSEGDRIRMWGRVGEFFGQTQLTNASNLEVLASGSPLPEPTEVDPVSVATGGADATAYEATLVRVSVAEVTELDPPARAGDTDPTNEFVLEGSLRVNDFFVAPDPQPFVGDVVTVTGVLRFANSDSKLEPRTVDDITFNALAPPALEALLPALSSIDEGAVDATSAPEPLRVELGRAAPGGGVSVVLTSERPDIVSVPASITVPAGSRVAIVPLTAVGVIDAPVRITASLGDATFVADVIVVAEGRVPAPIAVEPATVTATVDAAFEVDVILDIPARAGGLALGVTSSDPAVVLVPDEISVPARAATATINLTALSVGTATVTFSTPAGEASVAIEVVDSVPRGLILSEVFYNPTGGDDGKEWVELLNDSASPINLSGFSLGYGGANYATGKYQLSGTIPPRGCIVVGGPTSETGNFSPSFALSQDFSPDIQNSGTTADAIGIFSGPAASITASANPIDALVYGGANTNNLRDASGAVNPPNLGDVGTARSAVRSSTGWFATAAPTPGNCDAAFAPTPAP